MHMDHVDLALMQWRKECPELDTGAMGIIGRIKRLNNHFCKVMEQSLAKHGLNLSSFDVLATLRRSGEPYALSPSDLLEMMMVTSGTVTNRIDQLEKAGLVERTRNPVDARSFIVRLTTRGLDTINKAIVDHVAIQAQLLTGLTRQQQEQLEAILKVCMATFPDCRDTGAIASET